RNSFLDHRGAVNCLAFSGDSKSLAVVSTASNYKPQSAKTFTKQYDLETGKTLRTFPIVDGYSRFAATNQDGRLLVLVTNRELDGPSEIRIIGSTDDKWTEITRAAAAEGPTAFQFHGSGLLAIGQANGDIRLFSIRILSPKK